VLIILSTEGLLLGWDGLAVVKRSPRVGRGWDGAGGANTGLILDLGLKESTELRLGTLDLDLECSLWLWGEKDGLSSSIGTDLMEKSDLTDNVGELLLSTLYMELRDDGGGRVMLGRTREGGRSWGMEGGGREKLGGTKAAAGGLNA